MRQAPLTRAKQVPSTSAASLRPSGSGCRPYGKGPLLATGPSTHLTGNSVRDGPWRVPAVDRLIFAEVAVSQRRSAGDTATSLQLSRSRPETVWDGCVS